jgi:hypothetical protein
MQGKVHWIEWSMFCDRLDEALKPMRVMAMAYNKGNRSSLFTFGFRRKCVQSKTLKNLQRVPNNSMLSFENSFFSVPCGATLSLSPIGTFKLSQEHRFRYPRLVPLISLMRCRRWSLCQPLPLPCNVVVAIGHLQPPMTFP